MLDTVRFGALFTCVGSQLKYIMNFGFKVGYDPNTGADKRQICCVVKRGYLQYAPLSRCDISLFESLRACMYLCERK